MLVYESGTLDTRPDELPLSIGDGVLADTALSVVSVPEVFNYWLQPGRIDVGFLSGAQIDRFANLNTTVIGEYDEPDVRLPGSGGAPEIAASLPRGDRRDAAPKRAFVDQVDFVTLLSATARDRATAPCSGCAARGPVRVITDLGVLEPEPESKELMLTALHRGSRSSRCGRETGWSLEVSADARRDDPADGAGADDSALDETWVR